MSKFVAEKKLMQIEVLMFFYIVLFFFSHGVFPRSVDYKEELHDSWKLKKDKDGIQVYTRWIEAEDNRKARQLHAVMFIDASVYSSLKALEDREQLLMICQMSFLKMKRNEA
jgi:hypothetical protein